MDSTARRQGHREDTADLHRQVAAEIRRAIADGEAKPAERLPPAVDLAAILGVNRNTVLRALRDLRDEGLLEFRRGRGVTVTGTPPQGAVHRHARELVELAQGMATGARSCSRWSRSSPSQTPRPRDVSVLCAAYRARNGKEGEGSCGHSLRRSGRPRGARACVPAVALTLRA